MCWKATVSENINPMDYTGMKPVRRGAQPISGDTGLKDIQALAEAPQFVPATTSDKLTRQSILAPFVAHFRTYIDAAALKPLKLVVNAGNGAAGHVIDAIEDAFRQIGAAVTFINVYHQPDGSFPNGIPNPLLPENRAASAEAGRHTKPTWRLAGTATLTAAFCSKKAATSLRVITSLACLQNFFWPCTTAKKSFMTHA